MFQILLIDDDPIIQKVLQKTLSDQGYQVFSARNGEDGLVQAQKLRPALIICDWQMPGIDGLDVCRWVKANPALTATFFILLTSRTAISDRVQGLDTGADDFLTKPIDLSELKARVRAGLRLYQSVQELKLMAQNLQRQQQLLETELAEAAEYVRSRLPQPMSQKTVQINSRFLPSRHLGGDCFDYYWLDPDYLMIYLLDVSGHGMGSALPSVSIQNLLRSQALPDTNFYQPSDVLTSLNNVFQMGEQSDRYFTIWYGIYDQQHHQLFYSNAGHPPAVLLTGDGERLEVTQLKASGLPIGMFTDTEFKNERCQIEPSSLLYIFSDGIYELEQPNGTVWGLDHFIEVLADSKIPSEQQIEHVFEVAQMMNGGQPFEDDCSLLQVHFS